MPTWFEKYELSLVDRLRRSLYEVLRDQLDIYLIKHALIDSYWKFRRAGEPYPFVEKRELKPRARVNQREFSKQNSFLVIFCEGTIPSKHSKYIRFFDTNKVTKEAINEIANIELSTDYTRNLRYFMDLNLFVEQFLVDKQDDYGLCIFQVIYTNTRFAKPPQDNALRRLQPDYNWLTVSNQLLVPLADYPNVYPLHYKTIYGPE